MMDMPTETRLETIAQLQRQIGVCERGAWGAAEVVSTGCTAVDQLLPGGGVRRGGLIEWIAQTHGGGAGTLSLIAARQVCPAEKTVVIIDAERRIAPAALANLGFDLSKVWIVRPQTKQEAWWTGEEALRCAAVGLVWADIQHLPTTQFRRWQLAVEASQGVGFLLRPELALRHTSWADARLLVRSVRSRDASPTYQVESVYSQGRTSRSKAGVQINRFTGMVHESASLLSTNPHATNPLSLVS
ncbi:hypothetical protein LOC68_22515 [Blastopirellula sp. JC732]|uniref:RecA-like N-terminal domain-containing protein n=1 Tax=Blastopirellula sediminis TaxID=2894196 RepID=A0A9X1MQS8_9BACT|nr:hypothetical protein [Blastopirellula sediminis]MCC9605524.1 hypothetical protein [Blastopirellula sediminis]MCC9631176.1 hypothetical protein [Blastopirellula sediminis]